MTLLIAWTIYAIAVNLLLWRTGLRLPQGFAKKSSTQKPKQILIIGSTGGTGQRLVEQALERGYAVTAMARNPAKLKIEHPRLNVVRGDVLDYATVESAVRGHDAVLSALGHKRFFYPTHILSDGTRNIINAMQDNGAKRFVCETSLGIGDSVWQMGLLYTILIIPLVLPFYFYDKTQQEHAIAKSELDWTIVRPAALNNSAKRGVKHQGSNVGNFIIGVRISRADVADFMLDQLESDDYVGKSSGISW